MVTEEATNERAHLPVIDFTDFDGQNVPSRPQHQKKQKKTQKKAQNKSTNSLPPPPPQPNGHNISNETEVTEHAASTSRAQTSSFVKRPPGQSARQAYQQRLESDPSYVPTVGGFWGHDDRLLDKDLRSLSGWWRGRWQGYGRGSGFGRGRGRGGVPRGSVDGSDRPQPEEETATDVPPIERAWTHDGFEEMKRREDHRRGGQQTQPQMKPPQATVSFRGGRGATVARRGRGGLGRGGLASPSERSPAASSGRIWFSKKPELMWTKQHEGFLFFELDPSLKAGKGQGQGIQVKLPGKQSKVARAPPRFHQAIKATLPAYNTSSATFPEQYIVNLPKLSRKENRALEKARSPNPSGATTTVKTDARKPFVETTTIDVLSPITGAQSQIPPSHHADIQVATSSQPRQETALRLQLEQLSVEPEKPDPVRLAMTEVAVLKNPSPEAVAEDRSAPAVLPEGEGRPAIPPTLPTVYSPPLSQPSPIYGSPYAYPPTLPPGIAVNQHGMTYEVATGRPVYLQAPPPIYNPIPIIPSHPPPSSFTPGHVVHHSQSSLPHSAVSPDFLAPSASHTPPMNGFIDPSTGTPIFSFPRQTSRIEIRAPDGSLKSPTGSTAIKPPAAITSRSSSLRNTANFFEPSRSVTDTSSSTNGYFPVLNAPSSSSENGTALPSYVPAVEGAPGVAVATAGNGSTEDGNDQNQAPMMGYPHYVQHYYYHSDAYGYMHNPYVDMSQVRPYEMYPPHEGTVYY